MGTFGKIALWVLAIVGAGFVAKKYGPKIYDGVKGKLLSAKSKYKELTTGKVTLVSCNLDSNPAGGNRSPNSGVQSSPFHRWCYLVREGDDAGSISERITGDTTRYTEILVANPDIPKQGKMGEVVGDQAWDFKAGSLTEGTKIFIPQTLNAWIDQFGVAKGNYVPYPPDSRMIVDVAGDSTYDDSGESESVLTTSDVGSIDGFDY